MKNDFKNEFIEVYKNNIVRPGNEELLKWLMSSDFFTAPASSRFHLAIEGGLCQHSLHVYYQLKNFCSNDNLNYAPETIAISGLLHDVCKINYYKPDVRNVKVKDEKGSHWTQVPYFSVDEKLPFGHGEKSVFVIERFMKLKTEEAVAIRYHMGGFKSAPNDNDVSTAFGKFPLSLYLHMSDLKATFIDEKE